MSKGRVLTKKKWRNGQRRKPKNTYRSFKFPRTSRFHKEFVSSCERIDAGHEGIKVSLYGDDKGVGEAALVRKDCD